MVGLECQIRAWPYPKTTEGFQQGRPRSNLCFYRSTRTAGGGQLTRQEGRWQASERPLQVSERATLGPRLAWRAEGTERRRGFWQCAVKEAAWWETEVWYLSRVETGGATGWGVRKEEDVSEGQEGVSRTELDSLVWTSRGWPGPWAHPWPRLWLSPSYSRTATETVHLWMQPSPDCFQETVELP